MTQRDVPAGAEDVFPPGEDGAWDEYTNSVLGFGEGEKFGQVKAGTRT